MHVFPSPGRAVTGQGEASSEILQGRARCVVVPSAPVARYSSPFFTFVFSFLLSRSFAAGFPLIGVLALAAGLLVVGCTDFLTVAGFCGSDLTFGRSSARPLALPKGGCVLDGPGFSEGSTAPGPRSSFLFAGDCGCLVIAVG